MIGFAEDPSASLNPAKYQPVWDLEHLCLSSELLWALGESEARTRQLADGLCGMVRARHLCVTMSIGDRHEWQGQHRIVRKASSGDSASSGELDQPSDKAKLRWTDRCRLSSSLVLQKIVENMQPVRVTVHDLTIQRVPAIYTARTRLFFRISSHSDHTSPTATDVAAEGSEGHIRPNIAKKTKWEVCEELGDGLLGVHDEGGGETFEIIGLDDDMERTNPAQGDEKDQIGSGSGHSMAGKGRDEYGRWTKAEDMTLYRLGQRWVRDLLERTVVYKTTREAEGCESCGGK